MSELVRIKLRDHISILSGYPFASENFSERKGIPLIRIRDLLSDGVDTFYDGPYPDEFLVNNGDLLAGMDGDFNAVRWMKGLALLNQRVCKILASSSELEQGFLFWLLGPELLKIHRRTPQTTVRHLSTKDLYELVLEVPTAPEQSKIAQILDTLDTQIRQTEALIAKLERIKQGLLTDLLTRGIDQNGQLRPTPDQAPHIYKDSPLGRIPREWNVVRLESIADMVTSGSRDWARYYSEEGAKFIRIGNLTREHINLRFDSLAHVHPPETGEGQRTRLETGDILISITADLGIVGVVDENFGEAYINQHIALVRPRHKEVNGRFVGHFIASSVCQRLLTRLNDAGAKAGLNLPTIRNILVVSPKRQEQDTIQWRLDAIDTQIRHVKEDAKKLQWQKAGLMDDLLTGRVRVTLLLDTAKPNHAENYPVTRQMEK